MGGSVAKSEMKTRCIYEYGVKIQLPRTVSITRLCRLVPKLRAWPAEPAANLASVLVNRGVRPAWSLHILPAFQ